MEKEIYVLIESRGQYDDHHERMLLTSFKKDKLNDIAEQKNTDLKKMQDGYSDVLEFVYRWEDDNPCPDFDFRNDWELSSPEYIAWENEYAKWDNERTEAIRDYEQIKGYPDGTFYSGDDINCYLVRSIDFDGE